MAAGAAPAVGTAGSGGPTLCFSRSSTSWADWAEGEEGDPVELPVSRAPSLLEELWAAARPVRRWGKSAAAQRSALSGQRASPLPRRGSARRAARAIPRGGAWFPGRRCAAGVRPAAPAACVPWSGPARAARMRGLDPSVAKGAAVRRPSGPRGAGPGTPSAQDVAEACSRAQLAVDSANRASAWPMKTPPGGSGSTVGVPARGPDGPPHVTRGGGSAPRGGKLTHILKAISEPVGKLVTADLASFEDDGPARIEILCLAPAEIDGPSLIFYFGARGGASPLSLSLQFLRIGSGRPPLLLCLAMRGRRGMGLV
ncbi:hypothetical protein ZWY2020_056988 [Hordeum vulgare]|nr:hypothetical protein ZWY2020_056988 [Hordeum vulgare]